VVERGVEDATRSRDGNEHATAILDAGRALAAVEAFTRVVATLDSGVRSRSTQSTSIHSL